jgi:CBS domain-containing protein
MSTVKAILATKGSYVSTIGKDATVQQAASVMNEHKIGSLVVLDREHVVGMFTERDILVRVVGEYRDPGKTTVAEVMTTDVFCCRPETTLEEARTAMKDRRIRHMPVVCDDDRICGLISIGDLNAYQAASQEQTIYLLQEYLYGRV